MQPFAAAPIPHDLISAISSPAQEILSLHLASESFHANVEFYGRMLMALLPTVPPRDSVSLFDRRRPKTLSNSSSVWVGCR